VIDLKRLRHLTALVQHGNFHRAAEALHLTQPALTRSIQVLVGPVVGRLNALHPGLQLKLVLAPWQELPERARAREVDVVLGELREIEQLPDFECAPLSAHEVCVVARAGHPLASKRELRAADLFDWPLAGPNLPETALQALTALAVAAHVPPERLRPGLLGVTCDSSGILRQVLQESDALSFMPRFMVEGDLRSGRLTTLSVPALTQSVRFGAAWLRGRTLGGAGEKFVSLLNEHDAALRAGSVPAHAPTASEGAGQSSP